MQVSALMTELKGNAMRKRIGATAAALCVLLMVGCAPAVQAPIPTDNDATAGVRAGGAGPSTDNNTGSDINSVLSDEVTTEDGDAPQPTEGVTDNRDTAPPTDVVTTDQGDATPPPPLPQTNLDIYWVGPLECSIIAGGGAGGADGLTIFVGLRSGGETVTSLIPISASTDSGGNSSANAAAGTNGSTPVQVNLAASDYGRSLGVTVTADPKNTIAETDDSNNTLNISVDLPVTGPASQDVPCRAA